MINVIEAIEKQLQAQKDDIFFKNLQIEDLKNQLEKAEKENADLRAKIKNFEAAEIAEAPDAAEVKGANV